MGSITYRNGTVNLQGVPFGQVVRRSDTDDIRYSLIAPSGRGTRQGTPYGDDTFRETGGPIAARSASEEAADAGEPPRAVLPVVPDALDNTSEIDDNQVRERVRWAQSYSAFLQDAERAGMRVESGPGYGIAYRVAGENAVTPMQRAAGELLSRCGVRVVLTDGAYAYNRRGVTRRSHQATTVDDTVYLSTGLELSGEETAMHELIHVIKNTDPALYGELYGKLMSFIDVRSDYFNDGVLSILGKHEFGSAYTGADTQIEKCFDELIAYISGMSYDDPANARENFAEGFRDYDGFVREIQRMIETYISQRGGIENGRRLEKGLKENWEEQLYRRLRWTAEEVEELDLFEEFLPIKDWPGLHMSEEEKEAKAKRRVTDPKYLAAIESVIERMQERRAKYGLPPVELPDWKEE